MLLPPLLAMVAVLCLLLASVISFGQSVKTTNALSDKQPSHDELARQLTTDLEGTPTPADIRRARKPLSERRRLLAAHPYFSLYTIAKQRFGVSLYLVAAIHYQETGFDRAPAKLATYRRWTRHRNAMRGAVRPTRYPHKSTRHPSVRDDFDVVMAIAAGLKAEGSRGLGPAAVGAIAKRYGATAEGRLSAAMVLERARAWQLLGTLPLPGRGELATPAAGVIGGCGYFGCPRPGHLHNGVDFLAPTGTPIHAADAGVIASVESPGESGGYGNFVCIQHRPHLASCYAHMSKVAANVRAGARVRRGQVIGLVGTTGSSSASHLHFEVRRGPASCSACAVDPLPLLSGEVPEAALPKMVRSARAGARSARTFPAGPALAAPPPGTVTLAPRTAGDIAETDGDAHVSDPPIEATPLRNRAVPAPRAGGSRRSEPSTRRRTPAPSPAPAPAHAAPPAPAPAPPEETGTGGTTPDFSAPPPPDPAAAEPARAQGGG